MYEDRKVIHREVLFKAIHSLSDSDFEVRSKGLFELREQSKESKLAQAKLRDLIYDADGCIRILAAEALSITQSYPHDAIPVLETTLEVGREIEITEKQEPSLRICLGALYNYGEAAMTAEAIVWQYLYAQPNPNLKIYSIRLVSRLAKYSEASWTILCLLCQHQDPIIRNYAREIMSSEEFKTLYKSR